MAQPIRQRSSRGPMRHPRIVVHNSPAKYGLILLIFATMASIFVALLFVPTDEPELAWMGLLFFGALSGYCLWQIFDKRPKIILDDRGVFFHSLQIGVIPWAEIKRAFPKRAGMFKRYVCFELHDPEWYSERAGPVMEAVAKAGRVKGFGDIAVRLVGVPVDPTKLAELITRRARDAQLEADSS